MLRGMSWRLLLIGALAVAMVSSPASARSPEIYTGILSSTAVGGYDPVAYFREGKPVQGKKDLTHTWKGVTWRFVNAKNLDDFKAMPEAYAPQYGGYCAWAVSQGYTAKGDPNAWSIVDGKLYLNYTKTGRETWRQNRTAYIAQADRNWAAVKQQ